MVDHVGPAPAAAVQVLTAADRALLLYQYDQEPIATTERRTRMWREVARLRREAPRCGPTARHHLVGARP